MYKYTFRVTVQRPNGRTYTTHVRGDNPSYAAAEAAILKLLPANEAIINVEMVSST